MRLVVLRERSEACPEDRRGRYAEAAERELGEVVAELAEPRQIVGPAETGGDALEDALHALRADAARDADAAGLLREIREQPAGLRDAAHTKPATADLA